ncbi:uncharacterized protein [Parasteatoda tepidariorum]|uniref:uncharacterized protein n=1 Tax=Parasteatoda tepidariorum TaxID=114398 RepID=UPI001C71F504|nr:uncharacterized protein LOC122271495 [Parasteatoda tepidariorum]
MSSISKKRKRIKLQCCICGSQFDDDYRNRHEKACHEGKRVQVKTLDAPSSPFEAAKKKPQNSQNLHHLTEVVSEISSNFPKSTVSFEVNKLAGLEKETKDVENEEIENASKITEELIEFSENSMNTNESTDPEERKIVDVEAITEKAIEELNHASKNPSFETNQLVLNSEERKDAVVEVSPRVRKEKNEELITIACHSPTKVTDTTILLRFDEQNTDGNQQNTEGNKSWLTCLAQLSALVTEVEECKKILNHMNEEGFANPLIFLSESIEVITSVKEKCSLYLNDATTALDAILSSRQVSSHSVSEEHHEIVEHDPGKRKRICSSNQRKYLISLGPNQPKLTAFPANNEIPQSKQRRFNPSWYKEYPHLEYSVFKDAAFCFVCSLFPACTNREITGDVPWIDEGVRQWHKMKSVGNNKLGKLASHFSSCKASLSTGIEKRNYDISSSKKFDSKTGLGATGLQKKMLSFDFISTILFMKNILYKLKNLTEALEAEKLNIIDASILIESAIKSLEDINYNKKSMDDLLETAIAFSKQCETDPFMEFKKHHRRRIAPKRLDENAETQAKYSLKDFYRKEFTAVLDTMITLCKDNVQTFVNVLKPLFDILKASYGKKPMYFGKC